MFKKNDRVEKASGYKWSGVVVCVFETTTGRTRYVVECTVPEVAGALHIFNGSQLSLLERPTSAGRDDDKWIVRPDGLDGWRPFDKKDTTPIEIVLYDGDVVRGVFDDFWWDLYHFDPEKPATYAIRQYRVLPDSVQ